MKNIYEIGFSFSNNFYKLISINFVIRCNSSIIFFIEEVLLIFFVRTFATKKCLIKIECETRLNYFKNLRSF